MKIMRKIKKILIVLFILALIKTGFVMAVDLNLTENTSGNQNVSNSQRSSNNTNVSENLSSNNLFLRIALYPLIISEALDLSLTL